MADLKLNNVGAVSESSNVITADATGIRLYEFITPDAGTTVLMNQLGKIYD